MRMCTNQLQLNTRKMEVLRSTTASTHTSTPISNDYISCTSHVPTLFTDCSVSMWSHISRTVSTCFVTLRQIHSIRQRVPWQTLLSLVVIGFVAARLLQCNVSRFAITHHQQAAVDVKCFSVTVVHVVKVWPHDTSSPRAALAKDGAADRVQAHCACLPLPPRSGTTAPHQQSAAWLRHWHTTSLYAK